MKPKVKKNKKIMFRYIIYTRSSMEINGRLVGLLTTVSFGRTARGTVYQRVSLINQPGRLVHIQRVEVSHTMVRPGGSCPSGITPIVYPVYSDLVVVFAS